MVNVNAPNTHVLDDDNGCSDNMCWMMSFFMVGRGNGWTQHPSLRMQEPLHREKGIAAVDPNSAGLVDGLGVGVGALEVESVGETVSQRSLQGAVM